MPATVLPLLVVLPLPHYHRTDRCGSVALQYTNCAVCILLTVCFCGGRGIMLLALFSWLSRSMKPTCVL